MFIKNLIFPSSIISSVVVVVVGPPEPPWDAVPPAMNQQGTGQDALVVALAPTPTEGESSPGSTYSLMAGEEAEAGEEVTRAPASRPDEEKTLFDTGSEKGIPKKDLKLPNNLGTLAFEIEKLILGAINEF